MHTRPLRKQLPDTGQVAIASCRNQRLVKFTLACVTTSRLRRV